ncbi:MAG: hypothetical protein A2031_05105 [Deltaproteobacteria bacterium RBG_19FT_COMBO_43_11]|nr:MAG: hypothetical protein A2031_05105 [Deltaproteobacteria bacterium RBG_19FT_COMBO_43_11]
MYKIIFITIKAEAMKKTIDSINITLEMLQLYNDSLWANRSVKENEKIHDHGYYDIKEELDVIILKKCALSPQS